MTLDAGITLGILGIIMTIVCLFLAYYFGSKPNKTVEYKDLSSVHKSLRDIIDKRK